MAGFTESLKQKLNPQRIVSFFKEIPAEFMSNKVNYLKAVLLLAAAVNIVVLFPIFLYKFLSIFGDFGTCDPPGLWAVARGWINGVQPYVELFEERPPGIFMIMSVSLLLTDGTFVANLIAALATLLTCLTPLLYFIITKKESLLKLDYLLVLLLSCVGGLIWSIFTAYNMTVEPIGCGFACIYILAAARNTAEGKHNYKLFLGLATFSILAAIGMKEPMFFAMIALGLLFNDTPFKFIKYFLLPLVIACAVGAAFLAGFGILKPYLTFYLPINLEHNTESNWLEGLKVSEVINYLESRYHLDLFVFFLFSLFGVSILYDAKNRFNPVNILYNIIRVAGIIYFTTLAIGTGGNWVNGLHHFMGVPVYIGLFIYITRAILTGYGKIRSKLLLPVLALILIAVNTLNTHGIYNCKFRERKDFDYLHRHITGTRSNRRRAKESAGYIDEVLDRMKIDKYCFLGRVGSHPYEYTKHSPEGPFFLRVYMLTFGNPTHKQEYWQMYVDKLKRANFVVVSELDYPPALKKQMSDYLYANFTENPWPEVKDLDATLKERYRYQKYKFFYRKGYKKPAE